MSSRDPRSLVPDQPPTELGGIPGHTTCWLWHNVSIAAWMRAATREAAEEMCGISQQLAKRFPQGRSSVTFVVDGCGAPEPDARKPMSRLFDGRVTDQERMAIILEGGGFWASTIRSAITSMRMSAPNAPEILVCSSIDDVMDWLPERHYERTGVRVSRVHLRNALRTVRAHIDEQLRASASAVDS